MRRLPPNAVELALRLGLGNPNPHPPCHGYQHCCRCPTCQDRAKRPETPETPARQPWETKAA